MNRSLTAADHLLMYGRFVQPYPHFRIGRDREIVFADVFAKEGGPGSSFFRLFADLLSAGARLGVAGDHHVRLVHLIAGGPEERHAYADEILSLS